jgi:uncharacterized coiled-coil protein SlyX
VRLKCERCDAVTEHQQELREENARLRSVLEKIAAMNGLTYKGNIIEQRDYVEVTKQALEPKGDE